MAFLAPLWPKTVDDVLVFFGMYVVCASDVGGIGGAQGSVGLKIFKGTVSLSYLTSKIFLFFSCREKYSFFSFLITSIFSIRKKVVTLDLIICT